MSICGQTFYLWIIVLDLKIGHKFLLDYPNLGSEIRHVPEITKVRFTDYLVKVLVPKIKCCVQMLATVSNTSMNYFTFYWLCILIQYS